MSFTYNMSNLNINNTPFPMSRDSINKIFIQNTDVQINMPGMSVDQINMMLCALTIGSLDIILKQNWSIEHLNMVYLFISNMTNLTEMSEELYDIIVEDDSYEILTAKLSAGKTINLEQYVKMYKDKINPVRLDLIKTVMTLNSGTRETIIKTGTLGDMMVSSNFVKLFDKKDIILGNSNKGTHVNGIWIEHNKCPIKYKQYNFSFIIEEKDDYKSYYYALLNIIFGKEVRDNVIDLCKDDDSKKSECDDDNENENIDVDNDNVLYTSEELTDACHLLEAMYSQGMAYIPTISFNDVSMDTLNMLAPFNRGILKHTHSKTTLNEGHIALFTNYAHLAISRELYEMSKFMTY